MLRRQLPVHSPVTWTAAAAGVAAALRGDGEGVLRERLIDLLRRRFDARAALLTDSGTSALRLAIVGAVGSSGRPVALPGYTCYDMATAAEGAGASAVLYDIDPNTLGPDLESLRSLRATGPAAVVVGHLFGHLVDVASVEGVLDDALLIEDAAQGAGGRLRGRPLGAFGAVSVLSFGRGKGVTGGGGGALLAHDDRGIALLERVAGLIPAHWQKRGTAQVGALIAQMALGRPSLYGIPAALPFLHLGKTVYHPPQRPRPASAASLAIVERVLPVADRALAGRVANARRLSRTLSRSQRACPMDRVPDGEPGYLRLPAILSHNADGEPLSPAAGRLGIARGYPTTLAALKSLAGRLVDARPRLSGSTILAERLVTFPTHELLTESDLLMLEAWIEGEGSG